jgi:hypothetical protein
VTVISEPGGSYGLALRQVEHGVEIIKLREYEGDLYRQSNTSIFNEDLAGVADYLSAVACERKHYHGSVMDDE